MSDSTQASTETQTPTPVLQQDAAPPVQAAQPQTQAPVAAVQAPSAPIAPQAAPQTVQQPAAQPPPVVAAQAAKVDITSDKLKERLTEERDKGAKAAREALAADLGIPIDAAKKLIAEAKRLEEEKLSELQRRDKAIDELKPRAERATTLEAVVKRQADVALAGLTEEQRAAVTHIAGDDPVRVFDMIEALRPTWAALAPQTPPQPIGVSQPIQPAAAAPAAHPGPPQTPQPAAAPAPLQPPANSASSVPAPPSTVVPQKSPLEVYQDLQAKHPVRAAHYRRQYEAEIVAALKARAT